MYRRCPICGNYFPFVIKNRKYCSDKCRLRKKYYKPKPITMKTCLNCKKEFETRRSKQKFCSDKCKNAYHFNSIVEVKVCPQCGKSFSTSNKLKKYCDNYCYLMAKNIRDKKRRLA